MSPDLIWARGSAACAILSEGDVTVVGMATIEERLGTLEVRVNNLETWAGPGQAAALAEGQRQIRSDIAGLRSDMAGIRAEIAGMRREFGSDIATLKTDVATLKTDMAEVKGTLREVLRRLPAPSPDA
jgi:uncharacterized protein involved in exopolysaccharide biosynthesis